MQLIPTFDQSPKRDQDTHEMTQSSEDSLGRFLHEKWSNWSYSRRLIEEEWLKDLRAYNQINEQNKSKTKSLHDGIFIGLTRIKCNNGFSRIMDLMFQSNEEHWSIEDSPVPETEDGEEVNPEDQQHIDELNKRIKAMTKEMQDQLLDAGYEDMVKSCALESVVIGTGVIKGFIPGFKSEQKWVQGQAGWDIKTIESPFPKASAPSVFNIYPDPYTTDIKELTGLFELHVMTLADLVELKDDPRFDTDRINDVINQSPTGSHTPLWHEVKRRDIAGVSTTSTFGRNERYDLLEYWGQVSGTMLINSGVKDVEKDNVYWANVWTCKGFTLYATVMPMLKSRIPYNFFFYSRIPHQFWGISPARMMRFSQAGFNGSIRTAMDGLAMSALPQVEVDERVMSSTTDPRDIYPGKVWIKPEGFPSEYQAIKFTNMNTPTSQLMSMVQMFKELADEESAIPSTANAEQQPNGNETAMGMSMRIGQAGIPIKQVVKNLEDYCIEPLIESLYDWNMQWSDKEEIKADMKVKVLGSSALITKEITMSKLMQVLQTSNNQTDEKIIDRKYAWKSLASSMGLDADKLVPDQMPQAEPDPSQQPQQPQESALDQARAALLQVQAEKEKALIDKVIADTAQQNVKTEFSAGQTAMVLLSNPNAVTVADGLLQSAGFKDHNGGQMANMPTDQVQQPPEQPIQEPQPMPTGALTNTDPETPAMPPSPGNSEPPKQQGFGINSPATGYLQGVETPRND